MSDVAPSGGITSASLREAAPAPAGAAAAAPAAGGAAAGGAAAGGAKPPGDVHAEAVGGEEEDEEDEEEEEEEDEDGLGALGLGASTDEGSDDDEGEEEEEEEDEQTWVQWFCAIRSNAFLCEVDEEFITDDFNLTGLAAEVPYYDFALDTILDAEARHAEALTEAQQETVDMSAELLYGLVHARFVLTARGLAAVLDKFNAAAYGRCPRVYCEGQAVLPCGISDAPRKAGVALFCPRCNDIYQPKSATQSACARVRACVEARPLPPHPHPPPDPAAPPPPPPTRSHRRRVLRHDAAAPLPNDVPGRHPAAAHANLCAARLWLPRAPRPRRADGERRRAGAGSGGVGARAPRQPRRLAGQPVAADVWLCRHRARAHRRRGRPLRRRGAGAAWRDAASE